METAPADLPATNSESKLSPARVFALYGSSAALSILFVILSLQLWRADLRVPFCYFSGGDSLIACMLAKMDVETGWTAHNPRVGAPGTLNQLDFPDPHVLLDAAIHVASWFTHDYAAAMNACFLLGFPLIALTTTLAARQIGLGALASVLVAQLYTFQPFHFLRGEVHGQLSAYYALPLAFPAFLLIAGGVPIVGAKRATAVAGVIFVGLSGPYFSAFTIFFLTVAAVAAFVRHRALRAVRSGAALAILLFIVFLGTTIPNVVHAFYDGSNPVSDRPVEEGDIFGLRLTQMLLPVPGHRIPALARLRDIYAINALMVGENESSALGIVGVVGLFYLLNRFLFGAWRSDRVRVLAPQQDAGAGKWDPTLDHLAMLFFAGVLAATLGGLGPTFNYFGFTKIRSYNRISIFLSLFALLAVGVLVERALAASLRNKLWLQVGACMTILMIGLLDEVSPRSVPNYDRASAQFNSDDRFVRSIESVMPAGASIFQLPYMVYPEGAAVNNLAEYGLFRGYLHSDTLRWSFGAMNGRADSDWQSDVASRPFEQFLKKIRNKGFAGIYVDRLGILPSEMEQQLASHFGKPLVSEDQLLAFYKMTDSAPPREPASHPIAVPRGNLSKQP